MQKFEARHGVGRQRGARRTSQGLARSLQSPGLGLLALHTARAILDRNFSPNPLLVVAMGALNEAEG